MNKMLFLKNSIVVNIIIWDGEDIPEREGIVYMPFGDDWITIGSRLNEDGTWTHPSEINPDEVI